jgi:hypothetical protein
MYCLKRKVTKKQLHYHIDERGQVWLNLDYTAKYPGGPMSEEILCPHAVLNAIRFLIVPKSRRNEVWLHADK